MHKFFANAICSADSSTQLDPEGVDRCDYYTNQLRENGVYFSFSGVFHFGVRPGDRELDLGEVQIRCQTPFAAIYLTALERDGDIATAKQVLVTAIARARNTGMKFNETGDELLEFGDAPVLMEPDKADITIHRQERPTVVLLDHEGCLTSKTLAIPTSLLSIDGKRDRTMYYLISY